MVANRVALTVALGLLVLCGTSNRSLAQQEISNGAPYERQEGFLFRPHESQKVVHINIPPGKRLVIRFITGEMSSELVGENYRLVVTTSIDHFIRLNTETTLPPPEKRFVRRVFDAQVYINAIHQEGADIVVTFERPDRPTISEGFVTLSGYLLDDNQARSPLLGSGPSKTKHASLRSASAKGAQGRNMRPQ